MYRFSVGQSSIAAAGISTAWQQQYLSATKHLLEHFIKKRAAHINQALRKHTICTLRHCAPKFGSRGVARFALGWFSRN